MNGSDLLHACHVIRKITGQKVMSSHFSTHHIIQLVLIIGYLQTGATNRPQELDEAARRRLTKRLYIPLPSSGE